MQKQADAISPDAIDIFRIPSNPRLSDVPDQQLRVACAKCGYGWQYDRNERIAVIGDVLVAQFVWRLTRWCRRRGSVKDPCGARVVG